MIRYFLQIQISALRPAAGIILWGVSMTFFPNVAFATPLSSAAANCPVGTFCPVSMQNLVYDPLLNASDPTNPNTNGQTTLAFSSKASWDAQAKKFYFLGDGHLGCPKFITYDDNTDNWTNLVPPPTLPCGAFYHAYQHNTFNPLLKKHYVRHFGSGSGAGYADVYDVASNTWTQTASNESVGVQITGGFSWFPERGTVMHLGAENGVYAGLFEYNQGTNTWSRCGAANTYIAGSYDIALVHSPVYKILVGGGGTNDFPSHLWKVDAACNVTAVTSPPIQLNEATPNGTIFTVDPVSGNYILVGPDGSLYELSFQNSAAGIWTTVCTACAPFVNAAPGGGVYGIVATPISNYGVIGFLVCGGSAGCQGIGGKPTFYVYKHAAATSYDVKRGDAGVVYAEAFNIDRGRDRIFYAHKGIDSIDCSAALSAAGMTYGYGVSANRSGPGNAFPSGNVYCHWPTPDMTAGHLKGGSLKFTIPQGNAGTNTTGSWSTWMARLGNGNFFHVAPGSPFGNTINIQFYAKFDANMLSLISNCPGGCYGLKTNLIYGNPPLGTDSSTIEITTVLRENPQGGTPASATGILQMYGQQGVDDSYANDTTGTFVGPQPAVGCAYVGGGLPSGPCLVLAPDTWYEFTYQIQVQGPPKYQSSCAGGATSIVKFWINGTLLVDNRCASINYGSTDGDGIGSFEFNMYHTGATTADRTGNAWFTELVMSTNPIPFGNSVLPAPVSDTTAPTIPTNLIATPTSSSQINLSWTASSDNVAVAGYRVFRNGTQIATTAGTSYSNTGLTAGIAYSYSVAAYDLAGNVSIQSSFANVTTPPADTTAPTTPTSLTATAVSSSQINLSWTASTDAVGVTGYRIYRNGVQIFTTTSTTYSNTGLTASTAYSYTVAAYDLAGNTSGQSTSASAATLTPSTTTSWDKGFNFRATSGFVTDGTNETYALGEVYPVTRNEVTFGWNAGSAARDRDSTVDRRLAGINFQVNDGTQKTFRVDLPSPGDYTIALALGDHAFSQGYQYLQVLDNTTAVASIDDTNGTSNANFDDATGVNRTTADWPSQNLTITRTFTSTILNIRIGSPTAQNHSTTIAHLSVSRVPNAPAPDTTAPTISLSAPLSGSTVASSITVSATASDNIAVAGVQFLLDGVALQAEDTTSPYSITWNTTLTTNASHTLSARARDAAGNTTTSTSITVTVSNTTTPPPSTRFSLNDRVQVTTGTLNVRSTPSTSGTLLGTQPVGALGTIIGGPTVANGFNWWNINYDNAPDGWSVEDNLIAYTTPSDTTAPTTPTNLTATAVSPSQINLSWTASTDAVGVTGYRVYRNGTELTTTTVTSYSNTGLSPSTSYTYTVAAYDAAGNTSAQSISVSVATQLVSDTTSPTLSNVQVTGSARSATASWTTNEPANSQIIYGRSTSDLSRTVSSPTLLTSHSLAISGLRRRTTYYYQVSSRDASGNIGQSAILSFRTGDGSTSPITNLSATPITNLSATNGSVILSWTAPDDDFANRIEIYRSTTSYPTRLNTAALLTTLTNITQTSYTDANVATGITYYYTVYAIDDLGSYSDPSYVLFTPQAHSSTNTPSTTNTPAGGAAGPTGPISTTPTTPTTPGTVSTATTATQTSRLSLTRNLYRGIKGTDVKNLQTFLIQQGHLAPTNDSGFYGALTKQAVEKYQCAKNLICSGTEVSTGYGVVGPKTRTMLNSSSVSSGSTTFTTNLTPAQADAIIALVQSFGAEQAVVDQVKRSLGR